MTGRTRDNVMASVDWRTDRAAQPRDPSDMSSVRSATIYRFCLLTVLVPASAAAQVSFDCAAPSTPTLTSTVVLGNGSAGSVTTTALQNALSDGGDIQLNVGASTIALTQELIVSKATTLDANGATLSGGNTHRVLQVTNPGNTTYTFNLLNATVSGGNSVNSGTTTSDKSGAGLWKPTGGPWQAVTIRIFRSRFTGNTAIVTAQDDGGGGAYVVGAAEFSVIDSTFDHNSGSNGGAFYSLGSKTVNVFDSTLNNNVATGTGGNPGNGGNGGAVGVDGDARNVNFCRARVLANQAMVYGGGLFTVTYSAASYTRIENSTFDANAGGTSALAGGAYIQGSPLTVYGSTFSNNTAGGYAGVALFGQGGVLNGDVTNSTFAANRATGGLGGAMSIQGATSLLLQNLTIANNSSTCGGGCFDGGIANDTSPLTLRNVIFLNNTGDNAFNPWAIQNPAAAGNKNLQWPQSRGSGQNESAAAPGTTFANALLLPLGANGGLTQTFALPGNSPAVNAGTATGAPATDQRGVARVGAVDIGAYEFVDEIFADGFE
jgi:hypothetical protein